MIKYRGYLLKTLPAGRVEIHQADELIDTVCCLHTARATIDSWVLAL